MDIRSSDPSGPLETSSTSKRYLTERMSFPKMLHFCRKKHVDLRDIDCCQYVNRPYIIYRSTLESYLSNIYILPSLSKKSSIHIYPDPSKLAILRTKNTTAIHTGSSTPPLEGPMIFSDAPVQKSPQENLALSERNGAKGYEATLSKPVPW